MKKLTQKKIKEQLKNVGADAATTELVLNNVQLYNNLIDEYNGNATHNQYLMYQLSQQIFKMLAELKKQSDKLGGADADDKLGQLMKNIKGRLETR